MNEPDLTPNEIFAANLRLYRELREMSQGRLAYLAEMHWSEISLLERAQRQPRLGIAIKLSAVLEIPIGKLFVGISWSPLISEEATPGRFVTMPVDHDFASSGLTDHRLHQWLEEGAKTDAN